MKSKIKEGSFSMAPFLACSMFLLGHSSRGSCQTIMEAFGDRRAGLESQPRMSSAAVQAGAA